MENKENNQQKTTLPVDTKTETDKEEKKVDLLEDKEVNDLLRANVKYALKDIGAKENIINSITDENIFQKDPTKENTAVIYEEGEKKEVSGYKISMDKKEISQIFELNKFLNMKDQKIDEDFFKNEDLKNKISSELQSIKKMGFYFFLLDFSNISSFFNHVLLDFFNNNKTTGFFIKIIVVDYLTKVVLISLNKYETKYEIEFPKLKARCQEVSVSFDNKVQTRQLNNIKDLQQDLIQNRLNYLSYLNSSINYLSKRRDGEINTVELKVNDESDKTDLIFIVIDSGKDHLKLLNNAGCLLLTNFKSIDFFSITKEGYMEMLEELKLSRLIIAKPTFFLKEKFQYFQDIVQLNVNKFIPTNTFIDTIQIMVNQDQRTDEHEVYRDNLYYIYDTRKTGEETYYRIIDYADMKNNPNKHLLVDSRMYRQEINIELVGKNESKADNINVIFTPKHFEKRKQKCVYVGDSCMDYEYQFGLCSFYFIEGLKIKSLDKKVEEVTDKKDESEKKEDKNDDDIQISTETKKVLESYNENLKRNFLCLNSGTGLISTLFDFNSNFKITSVEEDQKLMNLGKDYMGFKTSKENFTNVNQNYMEYLKNNKESIKEKFDIITLMNEQLVFDNDTSCPQNIFFAQENLENISSCLKPRGVFCLIMRAENEIVFNNNMRLLTKVFPLVYFIENHDRLNRIIYLAKDSLTKDKILYVDMFQPNLKELGGCPEFQKLVDDEVQDMFFKKLVCIE